MALLAFLLTPRGGEGECIYFPDLGTGRLYIVDAMTTHVDSIPVGNHLTDGAVIRDNAYILDAGQDTNAALPVHHDVAAPQDRLVESHRPAAEPHRDLMGGPAAEEVGRRDDHGLPFGQAKARLQPYLQAAQRAGRWLGGDGGNHHQ